MRETYQEGKRSQLSVPKTAWPALGFTDSMTIEQARSRAQQLNKENSIKKAEVRSIEKIAKRVERDRLHHSAFVPEDLNQAFIKHLTDNVTGSPKHLERILMHWQTAKKMIISLQLLPENFAQNRKQFYRYLATQTYSYDYAKKLLRIVNMYGLYCARITGKFFEPIPKPGGHDREMINDAYLDSESYYGPSEPLNPSVLRDLKDHLKREQHAWLTASLWLGLRPSELDMIISDRTQKTWRIEEQDPRVLWVFQPKLTSKPRHLRWKPIPILYPEQEEALNILQEGKATPPLTKTLKKYLGTHTTLYAGRKGFTDLMLEKGQDLVHISQWLGHSSIEMTYQRYKAKNVVGFTRVKTV